MSSRYLDNDDFSRISSVDKEFVVPRKPRLLVLPEARQRLEIYIDSAKAEIAGMGTVTRLGDDFLVENVYLLEQEASTVNATIDMPALAKFQFEMMKNGIPSESVKLFWHSHGLLPVFWSNQDDKTIDLFRNNWMISIVGNKEGKWKTRFDIYDPVRCTIHDMPFEIYLEQSEDLVEELRAEVAAKVRSPPKKEVKTKTTHRSSWRGNRNAGTGRYAIED